MTDDKYVLGSENDPTTMIPTYYTNERHANDSDNEQRNQDWQGCLLLWPQKWYNHSITTTIIKPKQK